MSVQFPIIWGIPVQMAEVAITRNLFADILRFIAELRQPPDAVPA